jgi:hypothetical protein
VDIKPRKRAAVGAAARYLTTRRNGAAILECAEAAPICRGTTSQRRFWISSCVASSDVPKSGNSPDRFVELAFVPGREVSKFFAAAAA